MKKLKVSLLALAVVAGGAIGASAATTDEGVTFQADIKFASNAPLSFIDVPRAVYMDAILGVYELNKVDLLRDVFIWAYERSAARYAAVRQSLGEPDPIAGVMSLNSPSTTGTIT